MASHDDMHIQFNDMCRQYDLNPLYVRQILPLMNQGLHNNQIAELTGISRVTVNNYVSKIRQHRNSEGFKELLALGAVLFLGYHFIKTLFGDEDE